MRNKLCILALACATLGHAQFLGGGGGGGSSATSPFSGLHSGFSLHTNPEAQISGTVSYTDYSGASSDVLRVCAGDNRGACGPAHVDHPGNDAVHDQLNDDHRACAESRHRWQRDGLHPTVPGWLPGDYGYWLQRRHVDCRKRDSNSELRQHHERSGKQRHAEQLQRYLYAGLEQQHDLHGDGNRLLWRLYLRRHDRH